MVRVVEMMVCVSGRVRVLSAAWLTLQVMLSYSPSITLDDTSLSDPKAFPSFSQPGKNSEFLK